jgi:hypothetical protein
MFQLSLLFKKDCPQDPNVSETKDFVAFLKYMEFGLFASVHCLLIPELRKVILGWFSTLRHDPIRPAFQLKLFRVLVHRED